MKENKKQKKDVLHSTWVRVLLIVLVVLMIGSMATLTGIFIFNQIKENIEENKGNDTTTETPEDEEDGHKHTEEGEKYY